MRYLICYTRPQPQQVKFGHAATFVPDVEAGDFVSDKEAIDRTWTLIQEKRYEYFYPTIDAIVRDDPAGPVNIFTAAVKADLDGREYNRRKSA